MPDHCDGSGVARLYKGQHEPAYPCPGCIKCDPTQGGVPDGAVEGVPGLKQARDAFDVAYHGHGKSWQDALAIALAVAEPTQRRHFEEELLSVYADLVIEAGDWAEACESNNGDRIAEAASDAYADAAGKVGKLLNALSVSREGGRS